ncbi:MAG: hypothetical protein HDT21_12145 [Ruminococcus sp.]|nr:hypothetical protein [Ruminococcus sp.]
MFAPPRNGSRRFSPPAPFGTKGDFALCGARPKAPPLDFASWAQLDQLMSAASPPENLLLVALCAKSKFMFQTLPLVSLDT